MPGIGELFIIMLIFLVLPLTGFWIWSIVDCASHERGDKKPLWLILVVIGGVVGAAVYFFVRRPERKRELGR